MPDPPAGAPRVPPRRQRAGQQPAGQQRAGQQPSAARPFRPARPAEPPLPDEVTGQELDRQVRAELSGLPPVSADLVARHLVMAAQLLDTDPESAYLHARAARHRAARVGAVREASGLAAYLTGRYGEALQELRATRRLTGSLAHLPVMADCERGVGRPERALDLAASPEGRLLDEAGQVELRIVAAGARRDLGQPEAAVLVLQGPELRASRSEPWWPRLAYAYADALLVAGRRVEAEQWFVRVVDADPHADTDAAERLAQLQGIVFDDAAPDEAEDPEDDSDEPGAPAPERPPH